MIQSNLLLTFDIRNLYSTYVCTDHVTQENGRRIETKVDNLQRITLRLETVFKAQD